MVLVFNYLTCCCWVTINTVITSCVPKSINRAMAAVVVLQPNEPKSMKRPTRWSEEVEEAYRFQLAGYRDEIEYKHVQNTSHVDRWPHNGFVKKLVRRDGCFYYYNKTRECPDKEIHKTKLYAY